MSEALFYKAEESGVRCELCPRYCSIPLNRVGLCGVRKNEHSKLVSLVYARPCAVHSDPIEKKPLFHFLPGETTLSIATVGCNFFCGFCQNWQISKEVGEPDEIKKKYPLMRPEEVVALCLESNSRIISYTYTEPTIFYEYMLDTARLARKSGLKNVMVSNGFINEEPLRKLCKYLDAANIDLKAFNNEFYMKICKGELAPVLRTLKILKEEGVWVEVTNLIVPGLNDDLGELEKMVVWISKNLGRETPIHFSRAHPDYKMKGFQPTPAKTLEAAQKIASSHLDFVYIGNVKQESNTLCPECGKKLIRRESFNAFDVEIRNGKCVNCKAKIPGVWD